MNEAQPTTGTVVLRLAALVTDERMFAPLVAHSATLIDGILVAQLDPHWAARLLALMNDESGVTDADRAKDAEKLRRFIAAHPLPDAASL